MIRLKTSFVVLTIAMVSVFSFAGSGPAISIGEMHHDLGEVAQGEVLEVEFEVENLGDEPLEMTVRPTCGCTVVEHDRVVEPGSKGTIIAQVDTAEFSGPTKKSLLVASNDPHSSVLTLTVRADIK